MKPVFLLFLLLIWSCQRKDCSEPSVFAPGIISTSAVEYSASFSQDLSEVYFVRSKGAWGKGSLESSIFYSQKVDDEWSDPALTSFSGQFDDSDPHLTEDGTKLYFVSDRPSDAETNSADIWVVNRLASGAWSDPVRLPDHINTPLTEYGPKTTSNGDLYFAATRPEGLGQGDLYMSNYTSEGFSEPINLGSVVNSHLGEWNLGISNDGQLLMYEASGRPENKSSYGDLYISFRKDEQWTIPQNVEELNTEGSNLYPQFLLNNTRLIYSSSETKESPNVDIYSTDFSELLKKYEGNAQLPRKYLLVANRSGHSISVVDLQEEKVIRNFEVGKGPHEISVSADRRFVFAANYGSYPRPHEDPISSNELEWMDEVQNTVTRISLADGGTETFEIPNSDSPHGILTNANGSIFWTTAEKEGIVKELDGESGELLFEYQTMKGSHVIVGTRDGSKIFSSNIESNTVSIIDTKKREVKHISTPKGPEGLMLSPDESELWILSNQANQVSVYNLEQKDITDEFSSNGRFPVKMTFINGEAWISNVFSKNITVFDARTKSFKHEIELETTPLGITSFEDMVYVTLPRKNLIRVFDVMSRDSISEFSPGIEA